MVAEHGFEVENLKGDLEETKRSLAADDTMATERAEDWDSQSSEWKERWTNRTGEILAIHEAIKLMNNDDALKLFKVTLMSPSLMQALQSTVASMDEFRQSSRMIGNSVSNLKKISVALNDKSVHLSNVISVIDEMVSLLKEKQGEDNGKLHRESWSDGRRSPDPDSSSRDAIADFMDQLSCTGAEIQEHIVEETIHVSVPQVMKETV